MRFFVALLSLSLAASVVTADTYTDATGDLNDGTVGDDFSGFGHLDIVQVVINNDATDLMIQLTLNADISTATGTDWGNYMFGLDTTSSSPGDTAGNGWARPINMPDGMDYWLGTWVNTPGGALQVWNYNDTNPGNWDLPAGTVNTLDLSGAAAGVLSFSVALADLGLSAGDTIFFDAYSTGGGGGDGAVDALSSATPSITTWGQSFSSPGAAGLSRYTVVPEPSTVALFGFAFSLLAVRIFRRR